MNLHTSQINRVKPNSYREDTLINIIKTQEETVKELQHKLQSQNNSIRLSQ